MQNEVGSSGYVSCVLTHSDVVEQCEGGGAAAGAGGDAVRSISQGAALPLAAAVLPRRDHLAVSVLQVHRPFNAIPGWEERRRSAEPVRKTFFVFFFTVLWLLRHHVVDLSHICWDSFAEHFLFPAQKFEPQHNIV